MRNFGNLMLDLLSAPSKTVEYEDLRKCLKYKNIGCIVLSDSKNSLQNWKLFKSCVNIIFNYMTYNLEYKLKIFVDHNICIKKKNTWRCSSKK